MTIPLLDCRSLGSDQELLRYCDQMMSNMQRDLGSNPRVRFERRGLDYFTNPANFR